MPLVMLSYLYQYVINSSTELIKWKQHTPEETIGDSSYIHEQFTPVPGKMTKLERPIALMVNGMNLRLSPF